jgi:FkbM family methyltransferase
VREEPLTRDDAILRTHGLDNLGPIDRVLLAPLAYLRETITGLVRYIRSYRESGTVIWKGNILRRFPLQVHLRNGKPVRLNSLRDAITYSWVGIGSREGFRVDLNESPEHVLAVTIHESDARARQIQLSGWQDGGDLSLFFSGEYNWLPVYHRQVLDIGANIGDSALYFIIKGATRVIAVEPFPRAYEHLLRNIAINGMEGRIVPQRSAIGEGPGPVLLPDDTASGVNQVPRSSSGIATSVCSIRNMIDTFHLSDAVLKMDCEGCEYLGLGLAGTDTLRVFSHMMVEYHAGCRRLKKRIEDAGFRVETSLPLARPASPRRGEYVGMLRAVRV